MRADSALLPRFVREALEAEAGDPEERHERDSRLAPGGSLTLTSVDAEVALRALEDVLPAFPLSDACDLEGARERFERTVSEPPFRYAPFFARAAELFDLSEEALISQLGRLREPGAWRFAGLPGISHVSVEAGPRVKCAETLFVRFKPGVYFPRHDHTGVERVLVLEGSYEDSHGVLHRAGELREWAAGTGHSFKVTAGGPCIFASLVYGRRFRAWPLRALSALLGR
jgi:hypothetical protein